MVCSSARQEMRRFYELNKDMIQSSGYRFVVVFGDRLDFFHRQETLYEVYPCFDPSTPKEFSTPPILIDITRTLNNGQN